MILFKSKEKPVLGLWVSIKLVSLQLIWPETMSGSNVYKLLSKKKKVNISVDTFLLWATFVGWWSLKDTLLLFLGHLAFVLLQRPLQVLVLLLGPADSKKVKGHKRGWRWRNGTQVKLLEPWQRLPRHLRSGLVPGAELWPSNVSLHFLEDGQEKRAVEVLRSPQLLKSAFIFDIFVLWVTYSFSWASRSLTRASRLLTSTTSSSSSSCSRLFWASVFCQSATREKWQPSGTQWTFNVLKTTEDWSKWLIFKLNHTEESTNSVSTENDFKTDFWTELQFGEDPGAAVVRRFHCRDQTSNFMLSCWTKRHAHPHMEQHINTLH